MGGVQSTAQVISVAIAFLPGSTDGVVTLKQLIWNKEL